MSAKENLTLWMEPELQAQAAALFNALEWILARRQAYFIGRRCVATVCLLRCRLDEPNEVTYAAMEAAERMRMFTGRLIAWRI